MPTDPDQLTLALVLTAAGATAAAALITGVIALLGQVPGIPVAGHERLLAFILSAVLVVVAAASAVQASTLTLSIASVFSLFLAWYGIARVSMAVYDDVSGTANPASLRTP